jgi:probable rRNA maturation factor
MPVTLSHTTKKKPPRINAEAIVTAIGGKHYDLSLVFVGTTRAQALNQACRGKSYVPNVLSFPFDDRKGEVYICPQIAKREAKKFSLSYRGYLAYLLIHGMLHLKGYDHGATMDRLERKYLKQFSIT